MFPQKKIHIFHFLKYWSKCESFSIIFFHYFIYNALRYNISTSFNVVCLGLAAIFPLFIASAAICGILSSVTPTSESVFGIPRDAFSFLISSTSISGLKSFTGSFSSHSSASPLCHLYNIPFVAIHLIQQTAFFKKRSSGWNRAGRPKRQIDREFRSPL